MLDRPSRVLAFAAAWSAVAALAAAQGAPPRARWEAGWHVVRPGDTLEGLARRLLGSPSYWRDLHRLNPGIADPDLLLPGRRIRIWVERPAPQPNAQVEAVAGKVDERPAPAPWRPAAEGDLLLERDGVRTWARGSSRLRFDDGAAVTLTENSLVYIRRQVPATAPVPRREIEVRVGQADLEAAPRSGGAPAIDVVFGTARGRAESSGDGGLAARTGASQSGAARLMIYRGQGEIAAAGQRVALPAGTGSTVAPKQPPKPAEALLPAPVPVAPEPDGQLGRDDPWLAWAPVAQAASYAVEVCLDAGCGQLVERSTGLAETRLRLAAVPEGPAYWRVTATGASGLDGFPSAPRRFLPVASVPPPAPLLTLRGADGTALAEGACATAPPVVEVTAVDRSGRALPWTILVGDREVGSTPTFPASGRYSITAVARSTRGLAAASPARAFVLDLTAPWADLPASPGPVAPRRFSSTSRRTMAASCALGVEYAFAGGPWTAVPCAPGDEPAPAVVPLEGERIELRLRAARRARLGGSLALAAAEPVALDVGDLGCGLAEARLVVRGDALGLPGLEIAVADRAGRIGRGFWALDGP